MENREIWEYKIIERVNGSSWSKSQKCPLSANHGDQACNQDFFRTKEISRNKATSTNISATANKQMVSW